MENTSIKEMLSSGDAYQQREACVEIGDGRKNEFIPDLIAMLKGADAGVREAAINALTSIGGREAAGAVAPLLRLDDASLRNIGIEILQLIGPDALDTISTLLNDNDDDVVKFAIDILANIKEERAVGLLSGLISHRNPNVRASIAVYLGKVKAAGAISSLFQALNDPEEWVRFSAVEGLGLMQDGRALDPLLTLIKGSTGLIQDAAIEAVGKIASPSEAAEVIERLVELLKKGHMINPGAVVDLLEKAQAPGSHFKPSAGLKSVYLGFFSKAMDDGEKADKIKALKGLALLRLREGLDKVFQFVSSLNEIDEDTEAELVDAVVAICGRGALPEAVKGQLKSGGKGIRIVIRALGEMKSEEAVPLLEDLSGRVAKHELREVVAALESIGSASSVNVLYHLLKNTDGHTRKIAARALAKLAGPDAIEKLHEALKTEKFRDVMEEITDVLSMIPSDDVCSIFSALLSEEDPKLREMGARGLGLAGDEQAIRHLERAAEDPAPSVRKVAYNSMARLGVPDAAETIIKGIRDKDDDVKLSVLKALNGWTGDAIKAALSGALSDKNMWVRYHAVMLLGEMAGDDVERLIIDRLVKDEAPVKAAAAKALERAGTGAAVGPLEHLIDHPDHAVRAAVENALGVLKCR